MDKIEFIEYTKAQDIRFLEKMQERFGEPTKCNCGKEYCFGWMWGDEYLEQIETEGEKDSLLNRIIHNTLDPNYIFLFLSGWWDREGSQDG